VAYSTQADIEKRIPAANVAQLTDDTNGTVTDAAVVTEAIALADALINSYLRGKHDVPLAIVPDLVREWSVSLSIYNLYKRRLNLAIPETLSVDYKDTLKNLGLVRDNKLMIDDAGSIANTAGFYKSNTSKQDEIFTTNKAQNGSLDHYFSRSRITPGNSF